MTISQKLMLIVCLTLFEISITIWCAFQISKGATFHQLNFLHVKYNNELIEAVDSIEQGNAIDLNSLEALVKNIRAQPIACIELPTWADKEVMKLIGTYYALEICKTDISDADFLLKQLELYRQGSIETEDFVERLAFSAQVFSSNSEKFEVPVTKTVDFIIKLFIPLIIFISVINIGFIGYLSRAISSTISNTIKLLSSSNKSTHTSFKLQIAQGVSGELKELLDIAEKRIAQDLLNIEHNEELQKIVDEKTASLQQSYDELEQFSYRTSHDLKGPLTRSKRLCRFILDDLKDGKVSQAQTQLASVIEQMAFLENLVEDLLSLAKIDLVEPELLSFDIMQLGRDIHERLKSEEELSTNAIQFVTHTDTAVKVTCDKIRMTQVLENLFANAHKYADADKPESWLKFNAVQIEGKTILTIEDNGIGIPEAYRHEVFEKFKRFHPHIGEGSGLGLSIVKKQVEKLAGSIEYQATSDGTAFIIMLPRHELSEDEG